MKNQQRSPDFRPNPERCVFLSEAIDQTTLDRLTPAALRLHSQSRGPITIYIDSPGGNVSSASTLFQILRSKDQDSNGPCRLITVATGIAASAAADLLMGGDYALAFPHSRILCHGVRQRSEPLTHESAIVLASNLASSNEKFAIQLADNCISRFIFRIAMLAGDFPEVRTRRESPLLPPTECFIELIKDRISVQLVNVLKEALSRSVDNDALDIFTSQAISGTDLNSLSRPRFELLLLKAILDYEVTQHGDEPTWSFRLRGLTKIEDKFDLLLDKYSPHHSQTISQLCTRWGDIFLSPEQEEEVANLHPDARPARIEQAVGETLRTLWFFFVSICRSLQKDDYWMTAEEAYWLGLIDEVIGRTDLPSPRLFVEYPPTNDEPDKTQ